MSNEVGRPRGEVRRCGLLVAAGIAAAVLAGCGDDRTASDPSTVTETVTELRTSTVTVFPSTTTPPPRPVAPATTTVPAGPKTTFSDGIWLVGTDVAAGTYATPGPKTEAGACAYTFLPRKGASISEAQGGNTTNGPGYMELAEGQVVQTIGCTWTLE